ncbi:helix-turn-helix domain-containing protein [Psychroflexus sp. MES1-P1E]|uniref:helix-turn-helix domain-containing protein n=1 Tax=Psychroflexus sp. MES1-P1E TaxID=2058320 RepID=UPI000C7D3794|nr:AraC family transcriptional regulator [Psychroflexus sp. MES1-P1E]PKG41566.1 AraC family transcriptional regulator [Psychroflexus sp. MES1-P1E]
MNKKQSHTIINQQSGDLAFKLLFFDDNSHFDHLQRNNYFTLIWLKRGIGSLRTVYSEYDLEKNVMFAFAPYQPFMIQGEKCKGIAIYFHSDFFCIHKHHTEVTCNGVLFNNIHQSPIFSVNTSTEQTFENLIENIKKEIRNTSLAQYEMLISYIKILLITASRIKSEIINIEPLTEVEPEKLQQLKDLIEHQFKTIHSTSEYSSQLNVSQKALSKLVKVHYNKTFKELLTERIIIEAKRELYLTNKTVKEIAYEMGYEDEYYFNRLFKKKTDISPQLYRSSVGFGKAEE